MYIVNQMIQTYFKFLEIAKIVNSIVQCSLTHLLSLVTCAESKVKYVKCILLINISQIGNISRAVK